MKINKINLSVAALLCLFLLSCSSTSEPDDNNNGTTQDVGPSATATWDPNFKYSGSGSDTTTKGLSGSVVKLVKYNGKLYGVGSFDYINGTAYPVNSIFVWTGSTIDSLPKQLGPVDIFYDLAGIRSAIVHNGKLEVSGIYAINGDTYISAWDGTNWTTGATQTSFSANVVSNGSSAYDYTTHRGAGFPNDSSVIFKYNGTTWDPIWGFATKSVSKTEAVSALGMDNTTLYVATHETGSFVFDAKAWVYKWEGGAFTELKPASGEIKGKITKLLWVGDTLYGLGEIQLFNGYGGLVKWNGTDWETLSSITFNATDTKPVVDAVTDKNGNIYVATTAAVYKYDRTTVTKLGTVSGGTINTLAIMGDKLFIGGSFSSVDGVESQKFAVLH